ncbi:hypothetical protein HN747_00170 [archaeon]|jgi:hypothetical protein|nr:hypothetical protein [archaeon]
MGLEGLLENVEGSTAAMQLMSKEASAEEQTDYIREFFRDREDAPGLDQLDTNNRLRAGSLNQIAGYHQTRVATQVVDNLPEILSGMNEQQYQGIGMEYSKEAAEIRGLGQILKSKDSNTARRVLMPHPSEDDDEKRQMQNQLYAQILSGFSAEETLIALQERVQIEQMRYKAKHFYSEPESEDGKGMPAYDSEKARSYIEGVLDAGSARDEKGNFNPESTLVNASYELANMYLQNAKPKK